MKYLAFHWRDIRGIFTVDKPGWIKIGQNT
jgi:hypothetical protein